MIANLDEAPKRRHIGTLLWANRCWHSQAARCLSPIGAERLAATEGSY